MDGDLAKIILPSPEYRQVLRDPFAWSALVKRQYYVGPNRFVPHWTMERFFKIAPALLRHMMTPVSSVYASIAIAKTVTQAALLYLMSAYATGTFRVTNKKFLLAAVFLTPFFQSFGYNWQFGMIDASVTYCIFYATASVWLLGFLSPVFFYFVHHRSILSSRWATIGMIPLGWATTFNGPLNPAVVLLVCIPLLLWTMAGRFRKKMSGARMLHSTPPEIMLVLVIGVAFGLLSYVAGTFNIENQEQTLALAERYRKLPTGLAIWIKDGLGPKLLATCIIASLLLVLLRLRNERWPKKWLIPVFAGFAIVYILLLPLGGYREYRPYIIRRDSILPIIIGGLVLFAMASVHLATHSPAWLRVVYLLAFGSVAIHLTLKDSSDFGGAWCERLAIDAMKNANGNTVLLEKQCNVMAWSKITNPQDTRYNVLLLQYWHILPQPRLYFQR